MPTLKLLFDSFGRPLVHVEGKPDLPAQQQFYAQPPNQVPSFYVDFLVDTGATGCLVEESLIAHWHLMKMYPVLVTNPRTGKPTFNGSYKYPLALNLRGTGNPSWYHGAWLVSTVNDGRFEGEAFKGIIGMDMLNLAALHYVGGGRSTCDLNY